MALGIRTPGTRTATLKHLAAHLIWFRHQTADEAAATLTAWSLDPRHQSKDIAHDLRDGTTKVADQIHGMCRWYEAHERTTPPPTRPQATTKHTPKEVERLRQTIAHLDPPERTALATFLLHFLAFAKRHGKPTPDGSARDAAPAVRAVIRRRPGCHHNHYKTRIDHATAAGYSPRSRSGGTTTTARTYRIHVPVATDEDETLDYDAALALLIGEAGIGGSVEKEGPTTANEVVPPAEENDADHQRQTGTAKDHPPSLPEAGPDRGVGAGPHERDPQRGAAAGRRARRPGPRQQERRQHGRPPGKRGSESINGHPTGPVRDAEAGEGAPAEHANRTVTGRPAKS